MCHVCAMGYEDLRFGSLHEVIKRVEIKRLDQDKKVHNKCLGSCLERGRDGKGRFLVRGTGGWRIQRINDLNIVLGRAHIWWSSKHLDMGRSQIRLYVLIYAWRAMACTCRSSSSYPISRSKVGSE